MVCKASQNSLRELNIFQSTVMYGLDLYGTTEKAMIYCFGVRNLADVFSSALRDPSQLCECQDIAVSLTNYVLSQLDAKIQKLCAGTSLSSADTEELVNDVVLFWELFIARGLPNLFTEEFLQKFDVAMDTIEKYFSNNESVCQLPVALRRHIVGGSPVPSCESIAPLPLFARDSFFEVKESTTIDLIPEIVDLLRKVLSHLDSGAFDYEGMHDFVNNSVDEEFRLSTDESRSATDRIAALWSNMLSFIDLRVRDNFLAMVAKYLTLLSSADRKYFCQRILLASSADESKGIYDHKDKIKSFEKDLTKSINNLGDHNEMQNNPTKFHSTRSQLFWYIIVSPFETIVRLMKQGVEYKSLVPAILKIMQDVSPILSIKIPSSNNKKCSLIIVALEQTFIRLAKRLETEEIQENFSYFVSSLSRCKRQLIKTKNDEGKIISETIGDIIEDALLTVGELFGHLISPRLISPNAKHEQHLMMRVLLRLLQNRGVRDTTFPWTCELGVNWIDNCQVPSVEILLLIHKSLISFERTNTQMSDLCKTILKCLADKFRDDSIIFSPRSSSFVLSVFSKDPWWLRYALVAWFASALGSPKQQVPSGIYHSMDLDVKEKIQEIVVDFEFSPVSCCLTSLFELALFDVNSAIDLLNDFLVLPDKKLLSEQIALSLVDACGRCFRTHKVNHLDPLLQKLLETMDPTIQLSELFLTMTQLKAMSDIRSICLVSLAAKLAFAKKAHADPYSSSLYASESLDIPSDPALVADEMLQAFCELSKSRIEREMLLVRRKLQSKMPMTNKSTWNDDCGRTKNDASEYAMTQLFTIFKESVQLGNLLETNHSNTALRVLMSQLTENLKELIDMQSTVFLDNIQPVMVKSNTVYAYTAHSNPPENAKAVDGVHPATQKELPEKSASSNCFAENVLFDQNKAGTSATDIASSHSSDSGFVGRRSSFTDPQTMHPSVRDKFISERQRFKAHASSRRDFSLGNSTVPHSEFQSRGSQRPNYKPVHDISGQISNLALRTQIDKRFESQQEQKPTLAQPSFSKDGNNSRKKKGKKRY